MSSYILEFESAIDKVINNYILMSGSIRTSEVNTTSFDGERELSGVKDFEGNSTGPISTQINTDNAVTNFEGESVNPEVFILPVASIEPESPITSFSG